MSTGPITLRPGIDIVKTPLLNEGGFSDSNLIRWFNGLLQKLGGCTRLSSTVISGNATDLHPFSDLIGNNYIGIGTSTALQLYASNALSYGGGTSNLATTNISTVNNSTTVTVVDTNFSPAVGQPIVFTNAIVSPGGSTVIQGNYVVDSINPGANSYTFSLTSPATVTGNTLRTYKFESYPSTNNTPLVQTQDVAVGNSMNIFFSVSLAGSGLTPSTISPGNYKVIDGPVNFTVAIDIGSTTNSTAQIGPVSENGGLANIVYQAFSQYAAGSINNIKPATVTSNLATTNITVTSGSKVVTVVDVSYQPVVGETVTFRNAVIGATSATIIQGSFLVTSTNPSAHSYTFNLASNALESGNSMTAYGFQSVSGQSYVKTNATHFSSITTYFSVTLAGSGLNPNIVVPNTYTVTVIGFDSTINIGSLTNASASISPVFENGGLANITYTVPTAYTGVWSLDNWGQNLVGAPQGGPIYSWTPPLPAMSSVVGNGPNFNTGIFVAMPQQQMVSFGSDAGGYLDPLLVRWSDVGDYTSATAWTALTTNQAGSFRISSGSLIVGAMQGPQQGFIWTDVDMWVMQYIGFPFIYSFNRVGQACGLIAKRAATQIGGALWWLGKKGAFYYDGQSVKPLQCPIWDYFWNNVDQNNLQSVFVAENSDFNEVAWYFPTASSAGVPTNYIKLNILNPSQPVWDYGVLTRYAWCDRSVIGPAVGVDANNLLQQHETSNDLDGVAMDSWATTGWFKLAEGQDFITIKRIIWDSIIQGSGSPEMLVTVYVANYPNDTPSVYGPYTVTDATQYITVKARGRIARLKFESVDMGSFWRLGQPIFVISNSGRR